MIGALLSRLVGVASSALGPVLGGLIGPLLLTFGLAFASLLWRVDHLAAARDAALRDAQTLRADLALRDHALSERGRQLTRLSHEAAAAAARADRLAGHLEEIAHAPDRDDGPVAPVLGAALERLRQAGP